MGRSIVVILAVLSPSPVFSGDWHIPHPHKDGTPEPGVARDIPHTMERAGWPQSLSKHAMPSRSPTGIGYYIGGGAAWCKGEPRTVREGTWGWDPTGLPLHRQRVRLAWWHGSKSQGGRGAYRTDGKHVPDVIAGFTGRIRRLHEKEQAHEEGPASNPSPESSSH